MVREETNKKEDICMLKIKAILHQTYREPAIKCGNSRDQAIYIEKPKISQYFPWSFPSPELFHVRLYLQSSLETLVKSTIQLVRSQTALWPLE